MEVPHSRCIVPLHHLPPMSQEPFEFPSAPWGMPRLRHLRKNWTIYCSGTGDPSRSRLLQLAVFSAEDVWGEQGHDRLVESERICHPYQIQDEDSLFTIGVDQQRVLHVLD